MRIDEWLKTQPKVIGTQPNGSPIEGDTDANYDMRGRLMPRGAAVALLTEIQAGIGGGELPLITDLGWKTEDDPRGRKFYTTEIAGVSWELGQLWNMRSASSVGAPGRWVLQGTILSFVPDPIVIPAPPVIPYNPGAAWVNSNYMDTFNPTAAAKETLDLVRRIALRLQA